MPDAPNPNADPSALADGKKEAEAAAPTLDELTQWRNKVAFALSAANQAKAAIETELMEVQSLKSMIGADLDLDTLRVFAENERAAQDKLAEFASLKAGLARMNAGFAALEADKG